MEAVTQEIDGVWRRLRGAVKIETTETFLSAEEIDYNEETQYVEARGNVYFRNFEGGEELWADRAEYHLDTEEGKFYGVRGSARGKIDARPGVLTSSSPFSFQGEWADKIKNKYILHKGFITNCKLPRPWWILRGPKFDVIPNDRAIAYRSTFLMRRIPLFYTPFFYKSLERQPRKSGFLTPNLGNSTRRGFMLGVGYYWAINRSYDFAYRSQLFTKRGFAHHVDFRGKPRHGSDFNFILYGVNDRGPIQQDGTRGAPEGGYIITLTGESQLGNGFYARGQLNYLSSYLFRQSFTESFNESIITEVNSLGFVTRNWRDYGLNFVFAQSENFLTSSGEKISVRRLPQTEFNVRDKQVFRDWPLWFSLNSVGGMVRRNQPLFQTPQFVARGDIEPRLTAPLSWRSLHVTPSLSARATQYTVRQNVMTDPLDPSVRMVAVTGQNLLRASREFSVDVAPPSLERTFGAPRWLGDKLKHVIEPRLRFRDIGGIDDFNNTVRFDEIDILSNTREADVALANRFYLKRGEQVWEALTWTVMQRRYFDHDFGGAVVAGRRNVVWSQIDITGYTFLDRPRHYSPIISTLRGSPSPNFGVEWRADYDPLRGQFSNSALNADYRFSQYSLSLGHNHVRSVPLLSPSANQFRGDLRYGQQNRRGWNAGINALYDFRESRMPYATTEVTYNTDCCGFSVQYRRFDSGPRKENTYQFALMIANIGSFGTLKRQERLF